MISSAIFSGLLLTGKGSYNLVLCVCVCVWLLDESKKSHRRNFIV